MHHNAPSAATEIQWQSLLIEDEVTSVVLLSPARLGVQYVVCTTSIVLVYNPAAKTAILAYFNRLIVVLPWGHCAIAFCRIPEQGVQKI